jgi:hypothetical protein
MSKLPIFFAASLVGSLAACGVDSGTTPADGLVLTASTSDRVEGTFGDHGVAIEFQLTVDATGAHEAVIRDQKGATLLDSVLGNDGVETITFLGRETITGAQGDTQPKVTGDQGAQGELARRPEVKLFQPLRAALRDATIPQAMYAGPRASTKGQESYADTTLYCGQYVLIATYSWWWPVELVRYVESSTEWGWIRIHDGALTYTDGLQPGSVYDDFNYWWMYSIEVDNLCWTGAPIYVGTNTWLEN